MPLAREATNEGVPFEQCVPHGWKIISTAHQFCASRSLARDIVKLHREILLRL